MVLQKPMSTNKKVYRFGLYGRRNSGKTCILASLAMERIAHPDGLSCTWLYARPDDSERTRGEGSPNSDQVDATLAQGKNWLEQAIRNLEQGAVPPPNAHDDAFHFMYEFSTPDHRTFLVELIDYSGELIDPDLSDTELAHQLRQHMLTLDGILVLAEAPYREEQAVELYKELHRLKRAFAALRGEKQDGPALTIPVALLINKWDRRTQVDSFSPLNAEREVEDFLASHPEPPHRGLVDTLQGSVAKGLFKAFPVSAFGKHKTNEKLPGLANGQRHPDKPAQVNPLCSFGLEDGFVWACRCRDRIDLSKLESEANNLAWWKLWQLANPKARTALKKITNQLEKRFPPSTEEHRRVRMAARRRATAFSGQLGLVVMMLAFLYLGAGAGIDYLNYLTHRPTFDNLHAATNEQVDKAEDWLEQYGSNKWFFHVGYRPFYSGETAAAQLVSIREWRRNAVLSQWHDRWTEVEQAPDEVTKVNLAKKLRNDLSEGVFKDEKLVVKCDSLIENCETNRKIQANKMALQTVASEFSSLVSSKSEAREEYRKVRHRVEDLPIHKDSETKELAEQKLALTKEIDAKMDEIEGLDVKRKNAKNIAFITEQERRLEIGDEVDDIQLILAAIDRGMPFADIASSETQQQYLALRLKAQNKLYETNRRNDWLRFEDQYHALMRRGDIRGAAQRLVEKGLDISDVVTLKGDFCKKALPLLADNNLDLVKNRQWDRARENLKTVRTDKYVKTLLPDEQLRKIEDMEHDVDVREDKHLYAQVKSQRTRTPETVQKYLADAPLKTMRKHVEAHYDYRKKMEGPLDFEIEATVLWGPNCWHNYKNSVKINVDKTDLFDTEVTSYQDDSSELESQPCTRKLNDQININVSIKIVNSVFWTNGRREHGQGTFQGRVNDLRDGGRTIELDKYGNRVVLRIKEGSLPTEPTFPEWRE